MVQTADLSVTMGLSVSVLFICLFYNIRIKGIGGWAHELVSAPFGTSKNPVFAVILAVVIPAALFVRGLRSQFSSMNAATAAFGFFVWEAIKIAVSVGMLFAAPRLVADLDWLALLIGLVVTLKVYWVALLLRPKRKTD